MKKRLKKAGWFVPLLDTLGKLIARNEPNEETRQAQAYLEVSENYRAAVDRLNSKKYVRFYEAQDGQGNAQNLYIEAYFDGFEAGMKAAGVVIETVGGQI